MSRTVLKMVVLLALVGPAQAADVAPGLPADPSPIALDDVSDFALQITPYIWGAGLDGRISPFRSGPTITVDKPFSDILDELNFGGFINLLGRFDRFVISADAMYVDTSQDGDFRTPTLPIPIPAGFPVGVDVDSTQFTATLQGGYRVLAGETAHLDMLAGARFWRISNDVTVSAAGVSRSYGESFNWTEPVIGARGFVGLTDRLSLQGQADIGGFGAGSDLTWSVLATVNTVLTDHLSLSAGYKALSVDYDDDGYIYDTTLQGPVLGLTYRF